MKITLKALVTTLFLTACIAVSAQEAILIPELAEFPYSADAQQQNVMMKISPEGEPGNLINPASYQFTALSGIALEDMSTGTTTLIPGLVLTDFDATLAEIGFLYRFDNAFYTSFGANVNGFIRLGSRSESPNNTNMLDSAANAPKIAPYWDKLCTGSTGKIHYKIVNGPIGVRKLVIEWRFTGPNCTAGGNRTFQLWLYDRTGVIQFVYGNGMIPNTTFPGYSVGIQSGLATNFASVEAATNSVSYATANNAQTVTIPAGTSYLFTPNMPAAVTALSATPGPGSVTVNWTDKHRTRQLISYAERPITNYFTLSVIRCLQTRPHSPIRVCSPARSIFITSMR